MKNFSRSGKEERWCVMETDRHEGELGCKRAQEREVSSGEAGEVMGDIGAREGGRSERPWGIRMGDTKGLFYD